MQDIEGCKNLKLTKIFTCAAVDLAEGERHPVSGPAEGLDRPLGRVGWDSAARRWRVHVAADDLLV